MKILDGTLNHGGMTREKFSAIKNWRKAGNKLGIVTGRSQINREYWKTEHPDLEYDFLAFCNGGYIVDENGAVIYESRCENVPLMELADDLFSLGCTTVYVAAKECFVVEKLYSHETDKPLSERDYYCIDEAPQVDYFSQVSVGLKSDAEAAAVAKIGSSQRSANPSMMPSLVRLPQYVHLLWRTPKLLSMPPSGSRKAR